MTLPETPTVDQVGLVAVAEFDQHPRHRVGAALEHSHPIVAQLHVVDICLVGPEILAQREVERVDRAVALGGRNHPIVADAELHDRLRGRIGDARRDDLALDADVETLDFEEVGHPAQHAARQQFERGVGRLVGETPSTRAP